ncbi:hypothetical protein ACB098_11G168700 [Castanea mollissima]
MQTSSYTLIFQEIETAEPQENCSHKTQDQQPLVHQNLQWKVFPGKVISQGVARYRNFHNFESLQIQYCRMNHLLTNLEIFCHHNYGSVAYSSLYEAQASQVHPLCSLSAIRSTVLSTIFQLHLHITRSCLMLSQKLQTFNKHNYC